MTAILKQRRPEAAATTDNHLALGMVTAPAEAGLRDLAVAGFNNTMRGSYRSPTLTSIDVNPAELGHSAAAFLFNAVTREGERQTRRIVETVLIERNSTAHLPAGTS